MALASIQSGRGSHVKAGFNKAKYLNLGFTDQCVGRRANRDSCQL